MKVMSDFYGFWNNHARADKPTALGVVELRRPLCVVRHIVLFHASSHAQSGVVNPRGAGSNEGNEKNQYGAYPKRLVVVKVEDDMYEPYKVMCTKTKVCIYAPRERGIGKNVNMVV